MKTNEDDRRMYGDIGLPERVSKSVAFVDKFRLEKFRRSLAPDTSDRGEFFDNDDDDTEEMEARALATKQICEAIIDGRLDEATLQEYLAADDDQD